MPSSGKLPPMSSVYPQRLVCLTEETTEALYLIGEEARRGWQALAAVRDGQLFEIKSTDILQPGPTVLTDGVRQLHAHLARWAANT